MVTAKKPRRRKAMIVTSAEAHSALVARAELAIAHRDRCLDALAALLRCVDRSAFSWPPQQHAVREAEALLVESGRNPRGER